MAFSFQRKKIKVKCRSMEGQEIPRLRERQQREKLSDEEMGNLISAFGNHEAKAITLCLMKPGVIYSKAELHRAVIVSQGHHIRWGLSQGTTFGYCRNSLSPIGLVAREVINSNLSTYGYMKTEYGEKTGVPLAGLILDFSLRHPDFSLQNFFSFTRSPSQSQNTGEIEYKKRAPSTRLKIFREILISDLPIRTIDIANKTGNSAQVISGHLSELVDRGIVSYEAVEYGGARVFYRLSESPPSPEPEKYKNERNLTSFVYRVLREGGQREWSAEAIRERYQLDQETQLLDKQDLNKRILGVLSHLAKNGYAQRKKFVGREIYSEVNITEKQRKILLELVTLIDSFQNQEPAVLELGKRLASKITADPEKISLLLGKAKEHSSGARSLPIQETADEILRIISSHPSCTPGQVRMSLKQEGRRLSKASIGGILRVLIAGRKITQTTIRGVRHFNLADKSVIL